MAGPQFSCDVNTLLADSKCFTEPCMSEPEREAIELLVRVLNLAAVGGADYTNDLTQLQIDAKDWQTIFCNQRKAMELFIDIQNAIDNGASFDSSANALRTAAKCYECLGKEQKKRLMSFLKCAINTLGEPD